MLDPKGTSSQRHFTGLRLSSYLLLKTRHIPEFLNIYFTAGSNLFVLLSRYHRASKSDMRDMANSVIQLLVNIFQLDDVDGVSDNFKAQQNPLINDVTIYTDINRLIGDSSVYQHPIESSAKPNTQKLYKQANIEDIHGTNATKQITIKPSLNGKTVMEYMVAIADAMDYTTKSSNVYQHLYKALLHRSENITEVYENLESLIIDMDVENEERKFYWILNMLQFCLNASNKHERFKLLQRFLTTTLLCVSDVVENGQHLKATISRFIHNDQELRILYISDKPVNDSHSSTSKTNNTGLELQDNRSTKLKSLFKQLVALCLTSISRHLQHVLDRKTEDAKSSNLKDVETNELLTSIEIVYTSLEIVSKVKHVRSIMYDNQSSIPVIELAAKAPQKRRETEKHVPSEIDNLSARLMENGIRMKKLAVNTSNMMLITLCSEALGLLLSILSWSTYYMDKISSSSLGGGESQPLIVIDKIDVILPFAKSFAEAISTKKVTEESVLTSLLSSVLLDTLLIDDNSTVLELLHSITKWLWKMSSRLATREMCEDILQHSLIEDDFSEQSDDDMEDDSPSESDSETEVGVDDSEEDSTESGDSSEDEDKDSDLEDATSGDDEDEDTEQPDEMPVTKKQKMDTSTKLLGDESDLELSGVDALEELLKDEEGNLESLRMARMLQSTGINFSKESFNSMMRNLDLLRSCIPAFTLDEWYVRMVLRLYSSYERSISIRASKTPNDPMYSMLADYTSRIKKVLLEAMQQIASMMRSHQHAVKGGPNSKKPKLADSVEILDNLINLTLQAVRSQRMNIAKECRQVAVAAFVFCVHVESILNGGNVAVQSMMVLLTAICAACMFKNTKFGTNFFVQLSQRHPSAFNRINILKLALESKVSFVQSELLSICSVVVTAANKEEPLKPAKLCRRKCGRILDKILDDGGILKENAIPKQHLVSFITDNIYISTVQTLPDVLALLKANSEAVITSNVANESGKRPMKNRGISPQLTKAMGRLISNIVRCTTVDTKGRKHLENIKSALQDLLDTLSSSQGKNKQNKALMAAMTQLCRALDE
uniref:Uncharacterized protein n=2 Tax=Babesia bovis TaxID=5865 RepID=A7ARC4_BABBO|eukprot:XP_001610661.1 hypothetical protein [Babesia bovis T2Bo]